MIDIIVPHFGDNRILERCIESIKANTTVPYRLAIVNNNENNVGFARAVNEAAKQSDGDYIAILNNDVEVPEGWATSMQQVLETDQRIAAVGPLSTAPTQWQWQHNVATWLEMPAPTDGHVTSDAVDFPGQLAFWCVMLPRRVWDEVGSLDEQFFMYCEDDDWCIRAQRDGYVLALDLSQVVTHRHRTNYSEQVQRIHTESWEKFKAKWGVRDKPNVLIAVLNQGSIRKELTRLLIDILQPRDDINRMRVYYPDAKPTSHNRNEIVQEFLAGDWSHLMMIDSDTIPIRDPLQLLQYDVDIIGLPAPVIQANVSPEHPVFWNVGKYSEDRDQWFPYARIANDGLVEVDAVGTGCMIITREVLEHPDLQAPFVRKWNEQGLAVKGHDFYFCERAKKAGFNVHVHSEFLCEHFKTVPLAGLGGAFNDPDAASNGKVMLEQAPQSEDADVDTEHEHSDESIEAPVDAPVGSV